MLEVLLALFSRAIWRLDTLAEWLQVVSGTTSAHPAGTVPMYTGSGCPEDPTEPDLPTTLLTAKSTVVIRC